MSWLLKVVVAICAVVVLIVALVLFFRRRFANLRAKKIGGLRHGAKSVVVAFFHPYCNDGGGGERVLWCGIRAIQELTNENVVCIVYTGDNVDGTDILKKAKARFGITFNRPVHFVHLAKRSWVTKERWPIFTILGQSIGSMVLAWEALTAFPPHIFIDSMGYAFSFPVFKWFGGCKVGCYTHYPTVSSDMISKIDTSSIKGPLKYLYYILFAKLYGWMGRFADLVMVNSGWTKGHIDAIWKIPARTSIVYPPCDTSAFEEMPLDWAKRQQKRYVVSVGQFREEKNHEMQLKAFALLLKKGKEVKDVTLVLIGSCREDEGDKKRLGSLKQLAVELGIKDKVKFCVGIKFAKLKKWLGRASVGLHTMWCEHFGIGVVEMMAAGAITIAHNSGGPSMDIINSSDIGFLAATPEEYAEKMADIFVDRRDFSGMQEKARASVDRFSDAEFHSRFGETMQRFIGGAKSK